MKEFITTEIANFTSRYREVNQTATRWRRPLIGFASAADPLFKTLKQAVSFKHLLPRDILSEARTVVAFFLPFESSVAASNVGGVLVSREWALAYIETNALIESINRYMKELLESIGNRVETIPPTHNFDREKLVSDWSHRHIAYIAGLGKFGVNNMLITEEGCCGRIGSFVTDCAVPADRREEAETCLYRHDASCLYCVDRCVNGALFRDRFDRNSCHEMCLQNEEAFRSLGKADVCGKCLVGLPCSLTNPVREGSSAL
jgi:epoxyqueuosine reductase QueG